MLRNDKGNVALLLMFLMFIILILAGLEPKVKELEEYIKQLEQNQFEQQEEKDYYINRCQMLENLLKDNGLVVDDCECK